MIRTKHFKGEITFLQLTFLFYNVRIFVFALIRRRKFVYKMSGTIFFILRSGPHATGRAIHKRELRNGSGQAGGGGSRGCASHRARRSHLLCQRDRSGTCPVSEIGSGLGSASEGGSDPDTEMVFDLLPSKADLKIIISSAKLHTGFSSTKLQNATFYLFNRFLS
jgi:hypothetical protein